MKTHEEITGETSDDSLINHGMRWLREKDAEIAELKAKNKELEEKLQERYTMEEIMGFIKFKEDNCFGNFPYLALHCQLEEYIKHLKSKS